ncbi:hypothetical protein PAXRUDRAFT_12991 [Paxillus rubicundulus Ve08.2h10]|uniref:Major facilitator superfamily (MFS) profile domain-containing protein n=1 Tax=Paxillus rubicundulus Ve08.2h10 TaxID=930991 RepID=A0A0D0DMI5_9AGAM|nr:hypothetical protein PAXRUDRAFT_12991 [Paxillus rubicundulus Ve08.2h10]
MSPMSEPSSDTHPDSGPLQQMKELRDSEDSVAPALTAAQETKLWRKFDLRLIPIIGLMALLSTMDRGASFPAHLCTVLNSYLTYRQHGCERTSGVYHIPNVHLTSWQFNIALMMYFIVLWGFVMMLMGFVKTYPQLVGVRVCLGATEAGFYPGVAYCLTIWYPKYKYQYRMALLTAAAALAGACSGLLAYVIGFMNGDGGLEGWSWIFILQGVATMLVGLISAFVLEDYPSTAKFLTTQERSFVIEQHRCSDDAQDEEEDMSQQVWAAFTDWQVEVVLSVERMDILRISTKVWALSLVQISITIPAYGITYFLPIIINDFEYSISVSQLLTIPPYVIGAVTVLVFSSFSDDIKLRSPFIFAAQSVALLGYIINISGAPSGVKYFGTYLCIISSYAGGPGPESTSVLSAWRYKLVWVVLGAWLEAASSVLRMNHAFYSDASLEKKNLFCLELTRMHLLDALAIAFITLGLITIAIIVLAYKRLNALLDREELLERQQGQNAEHKESDGDRVPGFRYTL